jgi:hypothetical protein
MNEPTRSAERRDRSHFSDEQLYLAAAGVICGIAPSRLASWVGTHQPGVARILQMAYRAGIIRMNFLPRAELERVLHKASAGTAFHVVPDSFRPFPYEEAQFLGLDPVCIAAADLTRRRIERLMEEKRTGPIRIGLTGGYSLAKTVEALAGDLLHHEPRGAERLEFVALNAATPINAYHISSNHLVTRLSLLYSNGVRIASHLARTGSASKELQRKYDEAVKNLDLVLVSGGSIEGSYLRDYLTEREIELPPDAVGDLGYNLVRADGKPALCSPKVQEAIAELYSALGYDDLRNYAKQGNLIVVISEHRQVLWTEQRLQKDEFRSRHVSKLPLALALMREKLASEVVVGETLAETIVKEMELKLPEPDLEELREQLAATRRGRHKKAPETASQA